MLGMGGVWFWWGCGRRKWRASTEYWKLCEKMPRDDNERARQVTKNALVLADRITSAILLLRGEKVMLDADLASLYGVETKALVRAVKRNLTRFPEDFMFQLTKEEFNNLRYQFGTSRSWGGRRFPPYAFTERGVTML